MKRKLSLSIILISFILVSCAYNASLVQTSYKALVVSQTSYDTSMKSAVDLYKRGIFGEEVKMKILNAADIYHKAHNVAVEALAKYEETRSSIDADLLEKQINLTSEALVNLLTIIRPYLEK